MAESSVMMRDASRAVKMNKDRKEDASVRTYLVRNPGLCFQLKYQTYYHLQPKTERQTVVGWAGTTAKNLGQLMVSRYGPPTGKSVR